MEPERNRRQADQEVLRVREHVHALASKVQDLMGRQVEMHGTVNGMKETLDEVRDAIKGEPGQPASGLEYQMLLMDRRVGQLEKIVLGAVTLILVAVIMAWVNGAVIIPGNQVIQQRYGIGK